ncbi:MAG: AAA family ATPase [Phycisphaerales bacterium]|nr:MAG: AAA family ATPase [Phycisphaerales bacterium]
MAKTSSKRRGTDASAPVAALLPTESLRWRCDASSLPFESTSKLAPTTEIVGQDLAVEALRFGLETDAPGQNIFVRGLSGTGRLTLVRKMVEESCPTRPEAKDCCYVHNFSQPERPRLIQLPAGVGPRFRRRIAKLADFIREDLGEALSSEGIKAQRTAQEQAAKSEMDEFFEPFQESLRSAGLTLVSVEAGPMMQTVIFPLVDGKAVPPEEFNQLHAQGRITDDVYKAARENYAAFEEELAELNEKANKIRQEHGEAISTLLENSARSILDAMVRDIQMEYAQPSVRTFLGDLVDDVVDNHLGEGEEETDFTSFYAVNVVLEHKSGASCPVIIENAPTLRNLLGSIEFKGGADTADHMGIRAGSLLRADGGYLILEDKDILGEHDSWKGLMRVLRTNRLEITLPDSTLPGLVPSLKPEPIDIDVKVVMLGSPETYLLLDEYDSDFSELFKVLADFDVVLPRDESGVHQYAAVLARIAREENLKHFDRTAVAALAEHGARIAARKGKLTARFGRLADVAREAAFIAHKENRETVCEADVRDAVSRRKRRADLPAQHFRELVADGTIRVDTHGSVVGQINGLAVLHAGPMIYGFPTRITATIGPGTAGVINIEREAALSGAIHTKGFYILGGLLRHLLRTDHPLAFDASVAFEQSYGGIDGDSASGAEICCLLSAFTEIPLRQDIAMTGAIDQMGHILAVGAVDEKIEGFFDACRELGPSDTQGVIVPKANAGDLMLRMDVVEECAANRFQVYAVENVLQALEILTGMPAGTRDEKGGYAEETLLNIAVERAREYWLKAAHPSDKH